MSKRKFIKKTCLLSPIFFLAFLFQNCSGKSQTHASYSSGYMGISNTSFSKESPSL